MCGVGWAGGQRDCCAHHVEVLPIELHDTDESHRERLLLERERRAPRGDPAVAGRSHAGDAPATLGILAAPLAGRGSSFLLAARERRAGGVPLGMSATSLSDAAGLLSDVGFSEAGSSDVDASDTSRRAPPGGVSCSIVSYRGRSVGTEEGDEVGEEWEELPVAVPATAPPAVAPTAPPAAVPATAPRAVAPAVPPAAVPAARFPTSSSSSSSSCLGGGTFGITSDRTGFLPLASAPPAAAPAAAA